MLFIDVLHQRFFQFGRPPQLQQHVVQGEVTRHGSTVIILVGFGAHVAGKRYQPGFVNLLRDKRTLRFRMGSNIEGEDSCDDGKEKGSKRDIDVDCLPLNGTPYNCFMSNGLLGVLSTSNDSYQPAYGSTTGWDFATGIGTVNAYNLVTNWPSGHRSGK